MDLLFESARGSIDEMDWAHLALAQLEVDAAKAILPD
jgi:hypothetical protein